MKTLPSLAAIPILALAGLSDSSAEIAVETSASELIAEGERHALVYNEESALKSFEAAAKLDPENASIYVSISREYRHLASDAESKEAKQTYLKEAMVYALKASELAPSDSEAQLAPAITYGKMVLLEEESGARLELSRKIKIAVDKALALDATNDVAWYVIGTWHRGLAEVGGVKRAIGSIFHGRIPKTTYENAAECFLKAIKINPNRLMHHVELGRVYAAMGKDAEAKKEISLGLALKETDKDDPETKRRGRATLLELK